MSLFIGALAFTDGLHETETKLGVLGGSLLSALFGAVLLARATAREASPRRDLGAEPDRLP
jgi:NhaA family Na+:H+ antiporter